MNKNHENKVLKLFFMLIKIHYKSSRMPTQPNSKYLLAGICGVVIYFNQNVMFIFDPTLHYHIDSEPSFVEVDINLIFLFAYSVA